MMRAAAIVCLLALVCAAPAARSQSEVRFGVFTLFHPRDLVVEPIGTQAIVVHSSAQSIVLNGEPEFRRLLIHASGDTATFNGAASERVTVDARGGSFARFRLSVPGKIERIYEGRLTIVAHHGVLTPIVTMDRETAVESIVASEMPPGAPLEALKAQAVVTRSFLSAGHRHSEFDFCDTTHCQFLRSPENLSPHVRQAVASTRDILLSWQGRPIAALYSSRCGGHTRSLADLGMNPRSDYPYYGAECRWCREHPVQWKTRIGENAQAPQPSSEPARMAFARVWGWSVLPGSTFTATREPDDVVIEGHSIGHSLGLCQFGAMGMAASGADFRSILMHYFPNTELVMSP